MHKIILFGHRCSTTTLIEKLNLKTESYPFDHLVSKLDIIQDCIETNFIHFLDVNNYIYHKNVNIYNTIDNQKKYINSDDCYINTYYDTYDSNKSLFDYKLAFIHHNIKDNYDYFKRCIDRLYNVLNSNDKKFYIYIHPIMGINDFDNNKENILNDFDKFSNYITKKTQNIFGLYFILIKHNHEENIKNFEIKKTNDYIINIIYCNDDLVDGYSPFSGNYLIEQKKILSIIYENIFMYVVK